MLIITTYSEQIQIYEPPLIYSVNHRRKKDPYDPQENCLFGDLIIETREKKFTFTNMRDPESFYLDCDELHCNPTNHDCELFIDQYGWHCYDALTVEDKYIFPAYGHSTFTREQIICLNPNEIICGMEMTTFHNFAQHFHTESAEEQTNPLFPESNELL